MTSFEISWYATPCSCAQYDMHMLTVVRYRSLIMHGAVMVVELVSLRMLKSKLLGCTQVNNHTLLPGRSSSDLKIIQVRRECATIHKYSELHDIVHGYKYQY